MPTAVVILGPDRCYFASETVNNLCPTPGDPFSRLSHSIQERGGLADTGILQYCNIVIVQNDYLAAVPIITLSPTAFLICLERLNA